MGHSPWGHKELDTTERLILSLALYLSCKIKQMNNPFQRFVF